jgi:orotate phosphoribosyltransferase-like protein
MEPEKRKRYRRKAAEAADLYRQAIKLREEGIPLRGIAERLGIPYNTLRVYIWRAGFVAKDYRWHHIRIKRDLSLALKAAAEVRNTTPEEIIRRLIEVTLTDKILDNVLDDVGEA